MDASKVRLRPARRADLGGERGRDQPAKLAHYSGNAAWFAHGPGDAVLKITNRRRPDITGPHISPGAALIVAFASCLAALAARVCRNVEVTVVTAGSIDTELGRSALWLDDARPAHA